MIPVTSRCLSGLYTLFIAAAPWPIRRNNGNGNIASRLSSESLSRSSRKEAAFQQDEE
jgi:hypothetical protein